MPDKILNFDVVIVGAGMVGLTLANLLLRQGKSIAIIDQNEPPGFNSSQEYSARVTAVSPGSKAIFEYIDAWKLMQSKRISPFSSMFVWDELSNAKIYFNSRDVSEPNLGYIVENVVIQSSLYECLKQQDQMFWCLSTSVSDIQQHQEHIEIELTDQQNLRANLLVGADGQRSSVRNFAQLAYSEKSYQQKGIVARVQTEGLHQDTAWQRFLSTGPLALLPLSNGECSIVWSVHNNYAEELMSLDDIKFSKKISQASDYQLGNVSLCSQRAAFPLLSGQADSMVQPRIALVGDAAHAIHPLAGQGANLGFTDAAVLADILAKTEKDIGNYKVLRRYERSRAGETQIMQSAMNAFVAAFGSTSSSVITARNVALNAADKFQPLKRFFMRHAMGLNKDRPIFAR